MIGRYRRRRRTRSNQALEGEVPLPATPAAFKRTDHLLEAARCMLRARRTAACMRQRAQRDLPAPPARRDELRRAKSQAAGWTRHFHRSFELTDERDPVRQACSAHRLSRLEREMLCVLLLDRLSLLGEPINSVADVLASLCLPARRTLTALRAVSERGRLLRSKLVAFDDGDRDLRDRELIIDPTLVDSVLHGRSAPQSLFAARSQDQLYDRLSAVSLALSRRAAEVHKLQRGLGDATDFYKTDRRLILLLHRLTLYLDRRRCWPLAQYFGNGAERLDLVGQLMLLALIGKERGHLAADHELYTGAGLAQAACREPDQIEAALRELAPGQPLAERGLVHPCGGFDALIGDSSGELAAAEFELTDRALDKLGLQRSQTPRRGEGPQVRRPQLCLDQLVLAEPVRQALEMAFAQAQHGHVLVDDWGLGQVIPYGRAVTLLFAGPPGVGKTACAEALAHTLGRPILVADFSRIQNCFVGMTEKNISRIFRVARSQGAVLFWDEADAMFFDRDAATVTWEVRNVNLLLQELERFDGVCVLATNRRAGLDPALERRIAMKIDFPRPDRPMRRAIWTKLLPPSMPLAPNVDLDPLSATPLTGGQIKNAVLNAARLALARGAEAEVTMEDLQRAAAMESAQDQQARLVGFCRHQPESDAEAG